MISLNCVATRLHETNARVVLLTSTPAIMGPEWMLARSWKWRCFQVFWIKGWIITWIRSLGRFLSGVLNPDEVFSKSNAIVAISEIQRRCSKRSEMLTVSALKHLEHVCRHSSLAPPRQSCVCHSLCQPGNKSDSWNQKRKLILKTLKMLYLSVTLSNMV